MDFATFVGLMQSQNFAGPISVAVTPAQPRPSVTGNIRVYMASHADGGLISAYFNPPAITAATKDLTSVGNAKARAEKLRALGTKWFGQYWAVPLVWRNAPWAVDSNVVSSWQPASGTSTWFAFETLKPAP
jgi:hypothetical protein